MTSGFITLSEKTLKKLEQTGFRFWHLIQVQITVKGKGLEILDNSMLGFLFHLKLA